MSKQIIAEHVLKQWEIKYGYIGLKNKERDLFSDVKDKHFTVEFLGKKLLDRKVDKLWRIYVSTDVMESLKVGDVLIIYKDEKGNYIIKRK